MAKKPVPLLLTTLFDGLQIHPMLGFVFRPLPNLRLHSFKHDPSYTSLIEDEAASPDIPEEAEPPLIWELKWRRSPTLKFKEDEAV